MIPKIIGAVVILALLGGGGYYYYSNVMNKPVEQEATPTVSEAPTPTPTPEEVAKDEFTIKILNGSGIVGEAGRARTLLEDAEFTVDSTGNADKYDYEETVIQAKADVSDAWIEALTQELETKYTVKGSIEELDEDTDTDTDVVVIIGSFDADGETMAVEEEEESTSDASDEAGTATTPTKSPTPTKSS